MPNFTDLWADLLRRGADPSLVPPETGGGPVKIPLGIGFGGGPLRLPTAESGGGLFGAESGPLRLPTSTPAPARERLLALSGRQYGDLTADERKAAAAGQAIPGYNAAAQPAAKPSGTAAPSGSAAPFVSPDARLAPHAQRIAATALAAGVDPSAIGAAILQESGGDPTRVNPSSGAAGLLQALPQGGRGQGYSQAQLLDPDFNLNLAVADFRDAAQRADTEGRWYGWNVDDPVERNLFIIARAQRYGANPDGYGAPAYQDPSAPANQPFRQYLRQLQQAPTVAPTSAVLPPGQRRGTYQGQPGVWDDATYYGEPVGIDRLGATPNPTGQQFLAAAEQYKDLPYVWGGSDRAGVDCSGLIIAAARDSGHPLPGRPTAQGIYNQVPQVAPQAVQPGDLVFFEGTSGANAGERISHVGIVTAQGVMLNAPQPGDRVRYMRYDDPYWQAKIVGFGRLP